MEGKGPFPDSIVPANGRREQCRSERSRRATTNASARSALGKSLAVETRAFRSARQMKAEIHMFPVTGVTYHCD